MEETWLPVPDFIGYEVSNLGRVKRLAYHTTHGRYWPERILKVRLRCYIQGRHVSGGLVYFSLSRAILTAFVRQPLPGELARHLDDNPENNTLENLAWGSQVDNMEDAKRNGRRPDLRGIPKTEEHKHNLRLANLGKKNGPHRPETKEKMSKRRKSYWDRIRSEEPEVYSQRRETCRVNALRGNQIRWGKISKWGK